MRDVPRSSLPHPVGIANPSPWVVFAMEPTDLPQRCVRAAR